MFIYQLKIAIGQTVATVGIFSSVMMALVYTAENYPEHKCTVTQLKLDDAEHHEVVFHGIYKI